MFYLTILWTDVTIYFVVLFSPLHLKAIFVTAYVTVACIYGDADKSLAQPGRKQATVAEDFEFCISYLFN